MRGPSAALLLVSLLWGTTFVAVKSGLNDASPLLFVALRFALAAVVSLGLLRRRAGLVSSLRASVPLGVILTVAYSAQTIGLDTTTPARSAFITGANVAMVPLWAALILRKKTRTVSLLGLALTLPGLWLLASPGTEGWNPGDTWTVVCAVFFALHVVLINLWSPRHDSAALLAGQLTVTAVLAAVAAVTMETPRLTVTPSLLGALALTALVATVGTTWLQLRFQPRVEPTRAALIYATEPVFAALFSWWWFGELLPALAWAGGGLILTGALLAESGAQQKGTGGETIVAPPPQDPSA